MNNFENILELFSGKVSYRVYLSTEIIEISFFENSLIIAVDIPNDKLQIKKISPDLDSLKENILKNKAFFIHTAKVYLKGYDDAAMIYC